ncbi:FAD:protein FMN transferase [Arthrobacter sp. H35-D1]|uniref:FAD:protein FMN transferase n=1 Tax=Arthrobacter sp. H35-D1 TaxID=3046202 RepID=UPI0024B89F13|nr:FAD:protein FMN transferase [Arthrobacter sp. H35-D1]MDJ0314179.1 FAD:protein FMN transferase [Arthrobacter sp. H35-D1]
MSITVTAPGLASAAERVVREEIAGVDDACSRFRKDSELVCLQPKLAAGATVSPLLAMLVKSALDAAAWTDGDVDPTLGRDLEALGYDRDLAEVQLSPSGTVIHDPRVQQRSAGWNQVHLVGRKLSVPEHVRLDLGATAKAVAADRAAQRVAAELECGILVSLGGDIATAGPAPEGGWQVLVQDMPGDPRQQVTLRAGHAMATSSTQKRRWQHEGRTVHHILDPRFGLPAEPVWRSVSVAAPSCLQANAFSTAGIVRGFTAVEWFDRVGIAARLVDARGRVSTTAGWPKDGNQHEGESMAMKGGESDG